jgi:hypothetical protein
MSLPQLVRDTSGAAVQALLPDTTVTIATSGSSQSVAMPSNTLLSRLAANVDVFVAFGNSGVTATTSSMLFPSGAEVFNVQKTGWTHVAVLNAGVTSGVFTLTKIV